MSKSKSNSDDSVEVYTDEEIKLLDHYHEYSNNLFDDDELYDIFTRFNFNEQLIQVEIDQLMREMKKGKEYQWHDPNEKTKEPAKEKKTTHDKQGKKEYVNKYKNNYGSNYYYQNQKNYTYNNNYYNRNYNNYYNRRYNNRYNSNNYYYNNKRRYNDNKKYRAAKELKEVEITPIQSGEDTHEVIPEKGVLKNEIEKEEKGEVEPVQEVKPDVVEIEYKDNKEEVEVSHVPKPSKVKEPEQEKTRSVISETIETVPLKKEIQPSFEVYENTTFTLESAKPKKPVMSTPTEQPQYQPQQPTYQMPGNYPMYPFPFYPQYYNMMMPQGTTPQEGQPEAQAQQMPMYPQYPYYPYPYQMTEQQRAYMMNHK